MFKNKCSPGLARALVAYDCAALTLQLRPMTHSVGSTGIKTSTIVQVGPRAHKLNFLFNYQGRLKTIRGPRLDLNWGPLVFSNQKKKKIVTLGTFIQTTVTSDVFELFFVKTL